MNNELINVVKTLFGTDKIGIKTIGIFLLFSIIAGWLPDGIIAIFSAYFKDTNTAWLQIGFTFVAFLGLFIWLRRVADNIELAVKVDINPASAKGLILFLSENKTNIKEYEQVTKISDMKTNWQMPIMAIDYHKNSLSKLIIITSKESNYQMQDFKEAIKSLISDFDLSRLECYENTINFEDANEVFNALEISYNKLISEAIKKEQIYIDLTGGTKVVALTGSIFALPEDRVVQYISTTDRKVRLYDLQYHPKN